MDAKRNREVALFFGMWGYSSDVAVSLTEM
jgi:hypothetical protein